MISSALITIAGGISALPDVLNGFGINWQSVVSQEVKNHASAIIMLIAIFFGLMRWITTTPVGTPEPVEPPVAPPAEPQQQNP